ncbi:MAG: PAS domain S-box protein [Deltaproteobacteria bacterium]|nr:PAS domain S-box protein [Deltaproteobacteria bacterium]
MEYGLNLSLPPIRHRFLEVVRNHLVEEKRVFTRIVLIGNDGRLLVDAGEESAAKPVPSWNPFLSPSHREATIVAVSGGNEVLVSAAYHLRTRHEGQIIAWINPETIVGLLRDDCLPGRIDYLATSSKETPPIFCGSSSPDFLGLPELPPSPKDPSEFSMERRNGTKQAMVGIRLPIDGTPYSFVLMADAPQALGRITPQHLLAGMSLGAAFVLAGCVYLFFLTMKSSLLKERLDQSILREEALQASEARFRALIENAQDAIVVIDEKGAIRYASPSVERVVGYSPEELLGKPVFDLLDPAELGRSLSLLSEAIAHPGAFLPKPREVNFRHKNDTWRTLEFVGRNFLSDPRIGGIVLNVRDITERKKLGDQLLQAVKMEAVGKLAGGIAHDFNNLLTGIMGYSTLLLQGLENGNGMRDHLEEIRKAAERASALTRQLLAFSRKQIIQPKVLDLRTVIADLDKMLRRVIGEDVELLTVPAEALWKIKVDPGQIEQVILNLAVNARDSMPEGGKLTIETANAHLDDLYARRHQAVREGPHVMLAVSDTGCGIPREIQHRIFDPFFTTKEPGKGTGLGLSTVYGIVKQNMGNIWVYSEPGRGTTFKIYFPMVDVSPEPASPAERASEETETRRGCETLLVAEDDDLVRDLIRTILSGTGYTVLEARDGMEAWEIARRHEGPIHMLVTDVVMPRMGGRELAALFAGQRTGAKVLFLSGYTDDAIVRHGVLEAGVEFIQKPFRPAELVQRIRTLLNAEDRAIPTTRPKPPGPCEPTWPR